MKFIWKKLFLKQDLPQETTVWYQLWLREDDAFFLLGARLGLGLVPVFYISHFYLVDRALKLKPVELWFNYRYGISILSAIGLTFYLFPEILPRRFLKLPLALISLVTIYFQSRTGLWYDQVPYLYAYTLLFITTILLRVSLFRSIGFGLLGAALIYPNILQTGVPLSMLFSATLTTLFFIIIIRSSAKSDLRAFKNNYEKVEADKEVTRVEIELATTQKKILEKDLELSGVIQKMFLPKESRNSFQVFEIRSLHTPASQCGGDWWWYNYNKNSVLEIFVGDVTGHGAGPAILTGSVAAAIHVLKKTKPDHTISMLLPDLNDFLFQTAKGDFLMSAMAVEIDFLKGTICTYSAAAPQLLVLRKGQETISLGSPGDHLGSENFSVGRDQANIMPGDRFCFFTDGVTEAFQIKNPDQGSLGLDRLLRKNESNPIDLTMHKLSQSLGLEKQTELKDDLTLIMIDYKGTELAASLENKKVS